MSVASPRPLVRPACPDDVPAIGAALHAYLFQTEREKTVHDAGGQFSPSGELPERYDPEVRDPIGTPAGCRIFVADLDARLVGVVVMKPSGSSVEIKRLWASLEARGRGVGSTLLDAAIAESAARPVTLTVWDWRKDVIRLYESRGFEQVSTWDERPRLVCMRLASDAALAC
ncbi:GNAT family N-acetyltransferase [Brevibacterium permense]|uniref:GNAT family N-acetyltransferase n=1 Tax=Brevibacterium permense TaxID=234834 RepID=UPI0021CF830E|nr:GNAT family N-acetyltransferase [Brevibacterium permense]